MSSPRIASTAVAAPRVHATPATVERGLRRAVLPLCLMAALASQAALADGAMDAFDATDLDAVQVTAERPSGYNRRGSKDSQLR